MQKTITCPSCNTTGHCIQNICIFYVCPFFDLPSSRNERSLPARPTMQTTHRSKRRSQTLISAKSNVSKRCVRFASHGPCRTRDEPSRVSYRAHLRNASTWIDEKKINQNRGRRMMIRVTIGSVPGIDRWIETEGETQFATSFVRT